MVDGEGRSHWRERFTPQVVATLKIDCELWDQQYLLLKASADQALFDIGLIERHFYEWAAKDQLISYPIEEFNPDRIDENGYPEVVRRRSTITLDACRIYLHCDPKHKDRGETTTRPSEAAIAVVAVSPDFHVFLVELWSDEVGLEKFAERVFYLYRKWAPAVVTMKFIGAPSWLRDYARVLERDKYRSPMSLPRFGRPALPLPKLTSRLTAGEKSNETKEAYIVAQLQSWLHLGRLHLQKDQDHLLAQIVRFPDEAGPKHLLD